MKVPGIITRIGRAIANEMRAGNDVRKLQRLNDRMLADIGVARVDIKGAEPCLAVRSAETIPIPGGEALGPVDAASIQTRVVHASFEPASATAS
jgi:uncharacterized protein YjiS (DUF1127 family)